MRKMLCVVDDGAVKTAQACSPESINEFTDLNIEIIIHSVSVNLTIGQ